MCDEPELAVPLLCSELCEELRRRPPRTDPRFMSVGRSVDEELLVGTAVTRGAVENSSV